MLNQGIGDDAGVALMKYNGHGTGITAGKATKQ
jgi:hypothetical protein